MEKPKEPRQITDDERKAMHERGINPAHDENDEWIDEPSEIRLTPLQYMVRRLGEAMPPEMRRRFEKGPRR